MGDDDLDLVILKPLSLCHEMRVRVCDEVSRDMVVP
jgi:hypothetical protein